MQGSTDLSYVILRMTQLTIDLCRLLVRLLYLSSLLQEIEELVNQKKDSIANKGWAERAVSEFKARGWRTSLGSFLPPSSAAWGHRSRWGLPY